MQAINSRSLMLCIASSSFHQPRARRPEQDPPHPDLDASENITQLKLGTRIGDVTSGRSQILIHDKISFLDSGDNSMRPFKSEFSRLKQINLSRSIIFVWNIP